jgi:tRNA threonylcarbamoyl adenosine modification protein YeaZ
MILAIDTSLSTLRIGLFSDDGKELASYYYTPEPNERGVHDKLLAEETNKLLTSLGAKAKDIMKVALINGPGSFTGLRIGLAFAKGLAFANSCIIIPLTAHEVMASEYNGEECYLLYPGYEKGSYYASRSTLPNEILIIKKDELIGQKVAGEPTLANDFEEFTSLPLSLKNIVSLALTKEGSDISSLEPFYFAEFKPHPAAMQN